MIDYISPNGVKPFQQQINKLAQLHHYLWEVLTHFNPLVVLYSEQGKILQSTLKHSLWHIMSFAKTSPKAYHPRCDGIIEKHNRTSQNMLAAFVNQHWDDWDLWIDQVVYVYNWSKHEPLGMSPYEVVFGQPAQMPPQP